MKQNLNLFTFSSTENQLNEFFEKYSPNSIMIPPDLPLQNFTKRIERVCRFCDSPAGTKKFKMVAHIIPEFMGNKHLQSDFECDDCNSHFSKYETDLAAWLGMTRTVMGTNGKRGVPTFKSPNDLISARLVDFFNIKATKISSSSADNDSINVDQETGKTVITYTKESYTPIKVYKSLLKIALSMIEGNEIEQYRFALKYLVSDSSNFWCDEFAKVMWHMLPMENRFSKPFGFLFKKNCHESKLPMHVFMLYYETYIFAFPLPFNKLDCDKGLYDDLEMNFIFPPAILFNEPALDSRHFNRNLDLSSYEKIVGEKAEISFNVNPDDLRNSITLDPKTGKSTPGQLDAEKIVAVVFVPEGSKLKTD